MAWQEKFDELFPSGLKVTQIEDVAEGVGQEDDDSASFLTPQLHVLNDKGDSAKVQAFVYEIQKDLIFTILKLEEFAPGVYLAETPEGERDYLLSSNLPKATLKTLAKARV